MLTYQDLQKVGEDETKRMAFVFSVISQHKMTDAYQIAVIADEYDKQRNRTIVNYQKLLYTLTGEAVPDNYSANYKLCSNFFNRFVTQQNQYLLSNGAVWENEDTEEKLGKDFDFQLQKLGRESLVCGVAFGFWNLDHMESKPPAVWGPETRPVSDHGFPHHPQIQTSQTGAWAVGETG